MSIIANAICMMELLAYLASEINILCGLAAVGDYLTGCKRPAAK